MVDVIWRGMNTLNRRSLVRKVPKWFLLGVLAPASIYYYARKIEPFLLKINRYTIPTVKMDDPCNQFKIIHFTDTHIGYNYSLEQLKKLVTTINAEHPDIICFTGDLIDNPQMFTNFNEVADILNSLHAPYGKYWVYGNHDHGGYGTDVIKQTMDSARFTLLRNQSNTIIKNNSKIQLAGLDDAILGKPSIKEALANTNSNIFTCLLVHEPDVADIVKTHPVDIQLSGHSHGGQIRLPFIGSIITPVLARKYVDGLYKLNRNKMHLFVSRGIGTTRLPFRFLCKPEVNVYTIQQE